MNKPTPAIDENGEFVVAKLRGGQQAAVFCIDPLCALLYSGIVSEWLEDGRWSHESKHDHYLDIVNLDEIRATVERAPKMRAEIAHRAAGSVSFEARVGRHSFAEALQAEARDAGDFRLTHMIERARRASEGL